MEDMAQDTDKVGNGEARRFERRWVEKALVWAFGAIGAGTLFIVTLVWAHNGRISQLEAGQKVIDTKLDGIKEDVKDIKADLKNRRNP